MWNHEISNITTAIKSPAIRQKGESQNGCCKKTKYAKFSKKKKQKKQTNKYFFPPDTHTQVWVLGIKNFSFFGKFGVLCFLVTPVLRFTLLPYYRQSNKNY